jgi:hypothetical protein
MNRHVFFAIALLASLGSTVALALAQQQVTPPSPIVVNSPMVTINNSAGDQTQPEVGIDVTNN